MDRLHPYHFPFAKYPAVRIAFVMSTGIATSNYSSIDTYIWIITLVFFLLLSCICNHVLKASLKVWLYHIAVGSYLWSLFLFGGSWYALASKSSESITDSFLATYTWEKVQFRGELQQIRQTASGKYQLDMQIDSTLFDNSLLITENYKLRSVLATTHSGLADQLNLGDQIAFIATIYPLEEKRNPHQFDYKKYLTSQEIYAHAGIDTVLSVTQQRKWLSWYAWRQTTTEIIDKNFGAETAPLAKALLIGYKNELSREDKLAFSRVGLSHIMAVSGLHVGFLLAPFWFLIPFCWTFKYGRHIGLLMLIFILFYYAGLTGFSASVTRASITGGFIMYARLFNKIRDSINLTAVAAIIILLVNPAELFEIGFQLSFGAVYIILLLMPVISNLLTHRLRYRWYGKLMMIILVSLCVQVGLYPLLSYYFGEFSLIGPLANAVVIPVLGVVVPSALILLLVSSIFPTAGYLLNIPIQHFLDWLNSFVSYTSLWEYSWVQTGAPNLFLFAIWLIAISLIASWKIPRYRWKLLIIFLVVLCIRQGTTIFNNGKPAKLEITFFDVGQGDAALVSTPQGKNFLIDAGLWTPGYNSARYIILPHLKSEGIKKLDAVFLSHPHADHIGGIVDLINDIPIDTIYNSGYSYESKLYRNYLSLARQKRIPVVALSAGTFVNIDSSMRLLTYGPENPGAGSDPNEHSLILEIIYGETEFLFMGDAGIEQEERLIENFPSLLDTDLLKVGHHGSRTSSSSLFLNSVTPDISVVSLAKSNKFKHPHPEAVNRLYTSQTHLLFTSLQGALIFSSDGKNIRQQGWK